MKKSWKRIVRMLALLTAAAALFAMPALAELAGDLAGLVADQNHTDDQEFVDDPNAPEPTPEPEHHDELIVGYLAAQNASVNPLYCQERDLVNMNQLVFESLVTLDDEQKPVPMLADSWEHKTKKLKTSAVDALIEWLAYGQLRGMGQWRNAGWGAFRCSVTDAAGNVVFTNLG